MYRKKSIFSAIVAIVTILMLIGLMVLIPNCQVQETEGNEALGIALGLMFLVVPFGYPSTYLTSFVFCIVALIYSIKMLKSDEQDKLIRYNVSMLITSLVLAPIFLLAMFLMSMILFNSQLGVFPKLYVFALGIVYLTGIIAQIVSIAILKKAPSKSEIVHENHDLSI